jgi:hypothetical protein
MEKKINKSELISIFKRAELLGECVVAIDTWDGIMELATLVPAKHFKQYVEMLDECYDDKLDPLEYAPANTPTILDATELCFNSKANHTARRKRV